LDSASADIKTTLVPSPRALLQGSFPRSSPSACCFLTASYSSTGTAASSFKRPSKSVPTVPFSTPLSSSTPDIAESVSAPPVTSSTTQEAKSEIIYAPPAESSESDVRRIARETVAEDLEQWQNKFAQAADEGALEIEDRVEEIAKRMIRRQARTMGKSLIAQLQDTVSAETETLKNDIIKIVDSEKNLEDRKEEVVQAVRKVGLSIKEKAQDIRSWRENYEIELEMAVTKASESHFKILDSIRDLALQKIGMKWAWMDGITYKDWAKYHQLRDKFDEWTDDLKKLIVTHPGLEEAQDAAAEVEETGMEVAQKAAQELGRLKQVGIWKAIASDATPNFDSDAMKAAAEASQSVDTPGTDSSRSEVIDDVQNATYKAGQEILDAKDEAAAVAAKITSSISDGIASVASEASKVIIGSPSSVISEASQSIKPAEEAPTVIILEPPQDSDLKESANASDRDDTQAAEDIISSSLEDKPVSPATESVKPAMFGAAAQSAPSRKPIMDDDTDIASSISSAANVAYANAMSQASAQYSAAMSVVSAQIHGTPKAVHEQMLSSVTSAYSAAMASASSRLSDAYDAASKGVYGTQTTKSWPTSVDWAQVEAIASERLHEGRAWAEAQYESAKIALGLATPTPTSPVEKLYEQAKYNYYAGLGMAHARYSEFLSAASSALSSATAAPTPTNFAGTASSMASVASASVSSAASIASEQVVSAAQAAGEGISDTWDAAGEKAYAAGDSITEGWEVLVSQVSVQIYGVPTPTAWYESLYNAAGAYAATATSGITEGASAVSQAADAYAASASAEAAKQYASVSAIVSELVYGKEPTFSESVLSRFNAVYGTGAASASSFFSAASATAAAVVSEATEAIGSAASAATDTVKDTVNRVKDEL
jgi:hypothetical protein